MVTARREPTRADLLQRKTVGKIKIFDDHTRLHNISLAQYLSRFGYVTSNYGDFFVRHRVFGAPVIFLDDVRLSTYEFLTSLDFNMIDYIEINKTGVGMGMVAGHYIKIYTLESFPVQKSTIDNFKSFKVPLTFSKKKAYYVPKYSNYDSGLFEEYGVIGWFPELSLDKDNTINFKVFDTGVESFKLFVEGFSNEGDFFCDEMEVNLD